MTLRRFTLAAILLLGVVVLPSLAQGPFPKRIDFTINVPFELRTANLVLQPGNYMLFQIDQKEPHLFALYRDDMKHAPIAMIWTMRSNNSPAA